MSGQKVILVFKNVVVQKQISAEGRTIPSHLPVLITTHFTVRQITTHLTI